MILALRRWARTIRAYRPQRLRDHHLAEADVAGVLMTDPTNPRCPLEDSFA